MSTANDIVRSDYGLASTTKDVLVFGGPERRIWETLNVIPDPHKPGYFYTIQRLAGEWKKTGEKHPTRDAPVVTRFATTEDWLESHQQWRSECKDVIEWRPRLSSEQPITRVLYCTFDERGVMTNVYKDASQGKVAK